MIDNLHTTEPILQRVQRVQEAMRTAGLNPVDMRRAGALETTVQQNLTDESPILDLPAIEHLEGNFGYREIVRRNESRFRWFVDGSQKTLPVWRVGLVPVVVSVAVAGVLERGDNAECTLVSDSLHESISWIVPMQTGDPELRRFVDTLHTLDQDVRDPLDREANYQQLASMYDQVLLHAHKRAGELRAQVEQLTLNDWNNRIGRGNPNQWLVVDGRLTLDASNAIGLIKDPGRQHLAGEQAVGLLNLPAGHRTTAYRLAESNRVRVHWYQRMWPATGLDARHALIRIETNRDTADSDEIDDIATWLMAERVPRPTADSRWPTLLYPIHLLERMLKRRIQQITAGWPV